MGGRHRLGGERRAWNWSCGDRLLRVLIELPGGHEISQTMGISGVQRRERCGQARLEPLDSVDADDLARVSIH